MIEEFLKKLVMGAFVGSYLLGSAFREGMKAEAFHCHGALCAEDGVYEICICECQDCVKIKNTKRKMR